MDIQKTEVARNPEIENLIEINRGKSSKRKMPKKLWKMEKKTKRNCEVCCFEGRRVSGKRVKRFASSELKTFSTAIDSYIVRCCVKGSLLEVNERLIKQPQLLNSSADREGYIAIIMPRTCTLDQKQGITDHLGGGVSRKETNVSVIQF
ncbi:BnaCnng41230D [Brassica napus]|uniref:(rape) hypothetical protein n=1 Tax=Brassica napus TaxID=3708 RepID=A0A078J877_BRANA|nr:unnamed protein product [Brassica napus]CDY62983.1 BnaCnng41230D [Brassica napus]